MFSFNLVLDDENELDLTDSKFFGEIAVSEKMLYSNEFSPDEMFICQINLSNYRLYYNNFILPGVGTLMFFIDTKKRSAVVRYVTDDLDAYTSFNDDLEYDIDFTTELAIDFCEENEYACGNMLFNDGNCDGKVCLLKINDCKDEPLLPFAGSAYFLIDENDLKNMKFNNVKLKIID